MVMRVVAGDLLGQPEAESATSQTIDLAMTGYIQEAALLSWRYEAVVGRVGLLLDLRASFLETVTIGVLVARNVVRFEWTTPKLPGPRWYAISGLTTRPTAPFSISIGLEPGTDLNVDATSAKLYLGTSAVSAAAPPDFTEHDPGSLRQLMPNWETVLDIHDILKLATSA